MKPPGFKTLELRSACLLALPLGWTVRQCSPLAGVTAHHPEHGVVTYRSIDMSDPHAVARELAACATAIEMAQAQGKERT